MNGNNRKDIKPGLRVHITQKQDQHSGRLTSGVVKDILTTSAFHAGERQFVVSGIFLIIPNCQHNLLVAEHGFPSEQHRLRIPLDLGHPGWVALHQCPLVLANTDEAPDFRQILKTSHMGSALFGPMFWQGQMLGQVLIATQARNTYSPTDLDIFMGFAHAAAAVYMAHGGPEWLRTLV